MVYALWTIEWGVCFTDNCCNDNDALMDTGLMYWWILELMSLIILSYICHTTIIDICMLLKYKCECWWHSYTSSFDDIDLRECK